MTCSGTGAKECKASKAKHRSGRHVLPGWGRDLIKGLLGGKRCVVNQRKPGEFEPVTSKLELFAKVKTVLSQPL